MLNIDTSYTLKKCEAGKVNILQGKRIAPYVKATTAWIVDCMCSRNDRLYVIERQYGNHNVAITSRWPLSQAWLEAERKNIWLAQVSGVILARMWGVCFLLSCVVCYRMPAFFQSVWWLHFHCSCGLISFIFAVTHESDASIRQRGLLYNISWSGT